MFDPESFVVNGVSLMLLVFGLVEFLKAQIPALEGKKVTLLSMVLGTVLAVGYKALPLLPETVVMWIGFAVEGLAFGLAASGYYKYIAKKLIQPAVAEVMTNALAIGAIVHYVFENGEHRPAVVVNVWDQGTGVVNLQVLSDSDGQFNDKRAPVAWVSSVVYNPTSQPLTWHWPE